MKDVNVFMSIIQIYFIFHKLKQAINQKKVSM